MLPAPQHGAICLTSAPSIIADVAFILRGHGTCPLNSLAATSPAAVEVDHVVFRLVHLLIKNLGTLTMAAPVAKSQFRVTIDVPPVNGH
jgi:hypothetical protein